MDAATLVLAAIAAVAAVVAGMAAVPVALWARKDRPQHGWNLKTERPGASVEAIEGSIAVKKLNRDQPHKMRIEVHAIGTATVTDVELRFTGCESVGNGNVLHTARMDNGSPPLAATVALPPAEAGPAWVEIIWRLPRPLRVHAERFNLRTDEYQR